MLVVMIWSLEVKLKLLNIQCLKRWEVYNSFKEYFLFKCLKLKCWCLCLSIVDNPEDIPKNNCLSKDLDGLGFTVILLGKSGMVGYDPYSSSCQGLGGKGNGSYWLMGTKFEKVLEVDGGDGCASVWIYLMSQDYTHKNGWHGKFYVVCILPPKKNVKKKKAQIDCIQCFKHCAKYCFPYYICWIEPAQ